MKQSVFAASLCLLRLASLRGCRHCRIPPYTGLLRPGPLLISAHLSTHILCIRSKHFIFFLCHDAPFLLLSQSFYPPVSPAHQFLPSAVCRLVADPGRSVMSARFRLPAGRSYNVRATELERDRQHTQVVCNVLLLDNTVQAFKVSVSTNNQPSVCVSL